MSARHSRRRELLRWRGGSFGTQHEAAINAHTLSARTMLRRFAECGLGNENLLPRRGKTLHWNVDFLLDLPSAELVGISAIRSRKRLEDRLAKRLEEDPHTGIIERGLGANDVPGNTHLLHVNATEAWWASLPNLLVSMAEENST